MSAGPKNRTECQLQLAMFAKSCVRGQVGCEVDHGCNLHADCDAAERETSRKLYHCSDEDCEDCFGC